MHEDAQTNGHTNGDANGHTNGHANGNSTEAFVDGSVAISPNAPELVPGLLDQVASHGKTFTSDSASRTDLLDAARQLVYALETPREAMIRFCWSQVGPLLALRQVVAHDESFNAVDTICLSGNCRGSWSLQVPLQR